MPTMEIVRVEHKKDKYGFFHSIEGEPLQDILPEVYDKHFNYDFNRTDTWTTKDMILLPEREGLETCKDGKDWFCAFRSIYIFEKMFSPYDVQVLWSYFYKIYILTVTEFQVGRFQVLYTKESIIKKVNYRYSKYLNLI